MSELVEAAINTALLTRLKAFATANSLTLSYPGVSFDPPKSAAGQMWLRTRFLPAQTAELAMYGGPNQHYGFMQVDVMLSASGTGERPAQRMAAALIAYFVRGTKMVSSGFTVEITRPPFRNSSMDDDPWIFVPVRIPYFTLAT